MRLSAHFTVEEFEASEVAARKGIDNTLPVRFREAAANLCATILEPARAALGPLHVNSGYRCKLLNDAIGGAAGSQHMVGEAADIIPIADGLHVLDVLTWIYQNSEFDQLIWEFGGRWCHVSRSLAGPQRRSVLAASLSPSGSTAYAEITAQQIAALGGKTA